ncbi:coenzyme F420-0:L-glutamate ligase [Streptomyces sp. NPDC059740]|uniref:coenzyme F420-0:L-glutamate ligase n=1 Tax=Streptomyces sp. NPDC059740 TaxID=3346926 RepID=UPI00365C4C06
MSTSTHAFTAFAVEQIPTIGVGDDLAATITRALADQDTPLCDGDIVVVASKVISITEGRHVALADVTPGPRALELAAATGKPAALVQLILDTSSEHFLATDRGPIIALHHLGLQLTSAGIDRAGIDGAWLLPADPDASARALRNALTRSTGSRVAVVIADSDGRADRRGSTVISIGAAGIAPLRVTEHTGPDGSTKRQEETLLDLVTGAAGLILGQRGRGVPVVVLRGITYEPSDDGVRSILHQAPR